MLVHTKKSLGQHFLNDQNIARKIVDSIEGNPGMVLEIGPGKGILSRLLVDKYKNLILVEIDRECVEYLKSNLLFPEEKIITGDILKLDFEKYFANEFTLIGNFPYNISSQIFFKILDNRQIVQQVVCMLQKEVAERVAAPAGSKTYGILSVLLQAFYEINYLFTVHENVFVPPPKVKSAVIRLTRNTSKQLDCNEELFFKLVKTAFNQRRKKLRNSIRSMFNQETLVSDIFDKRPEQLEVKDFEYLTKLSESNFKM